MKRSSPEAMSLTVQPVFWLSTVFALVIIPVNWTAAWLAAVLFHEFGHYAALRVCAIPVYSVSVRLSGTYMYTAPMSTGQEILVASMGPVASGLLVLMSKWIPCTAICALFQLAFNLLPFAELDGERIIRSCLFAVLPYRMAMPAMRCVQGILAVFLCALMLYLRWGVLVVGIGAVLLLRRVCATFSCKGGKQIVQWSK